MTLNLPAGSILVTSNEYRTLFVYRLTSGAQRLSECELLADSATFRRQRGFHCKTTGEWTSAPDFTERKVRRNGAGHVAGYLGVCGVELGSGTEVAWVLSNGQIESLGQVAA